MDIRSLRFDVGHEVCGWGRLVRTVEGDFFDPPIPVRLPGSRQPARHHAELRGTASGSKGPTLQLSSSGMNAAGR